MQRESKSNWWVKTLIASNSPSLIPKQLPVHGTNYLTLAIDCHFQEISRKAHIACQHELHHLFKPVGKFQGLFLFFWNPCLITLSEQNSGSWGSASLFAPTNKQDIVYLVCFWTILATKSDSSAISALFLFLGRIASSRLSVARAQGFH